MTEECTVPIKKRVGFINAKTGKPWPTKENTLEDMLGELHHIANSVGSLAEAIANHIGVRLDDLSTEEECSEDESSDGDE